MKIRVCLLILFLLGSTIAVLAQPVYNMQNALVTDCEGVLLDSDAGPEEGQYDHNENFTFTICVESATEIIVSFDFFATEENYDILTVYDGPDTNSPVIATLSGLLQPAPTLVATSGCITFHFISDDNIVAIGWRANWRTEVTTPPTPSLSLVSDIECPMHTAHFAFDRAVPCEMMDPAYFSVLGPGGSQVTGVTALDCDPETGLVRNFLLEFSPPLGNPVNYRVLFNGQIRDACGNVHNVSTNVLFTLSNCPLNVWIDLVGNAGCEGECGELQAFLSGGSPGATYQYAWSHTAQNSQVVEICANDQPVLVELIVTDINTSQTASAAYTYTPLPNPVINNPIADTVCASRGDHFYNVTPGGGQFFSQVIPDDHRTTGRYQFWRWANADPINTDVVVYVAPNGCRVRDTVVVLPISVGNVQAACLDADPFTISGGFPAGGVWSGPFTTPEGLFLPNEVGSFTAVYTAPNGCSASKRIRVQEEITGMPDLDTICSNQVIHLEADPYGGRWSGPGVRNSVNGRTEAWRANINQWNTYVYNVNGCSASIDIFVSEVWAGPDRTLCASETLLPLNIQGQWSGPGVYLEDINAFDITGLPLGTHTYTLNQNGCTDRFELRLVATAISSSDALSFCPGEAEVRINDMIQTVPGSGVISGPGIIVVDGNIMVYPEQLGPGTHPIYFEALGCIDSMTFFIESFAEIQELSFCERKTALTIQVNPSGGSWSGPGFLDEQVGLFDPQSLGVGLYEVIYTAPSGCQTRTEVDIFVFEQVSIQDFSQQYCYRDTQYLLNLTPEGGIFTINGQVSAPELNPSVIGPGTHELLYRRGVDECASSERRFISILEPIQPLGLLANDSICYGQAAVVAIEATGGRGNLTYNWSGGLGFGGSQIARPVSSTWYTVTVTDQCSDPLIDSMLVYVHPQFDMPYDTGPEVCFEDTTFAILFLDESEYTIDWPDNVNVDNGSFSGRPGNYSLPITEMSSGCSQVLQVALPGARPLRANFSFIPNQPCIDIINNTIEVIELSSGYSSGWIDFGDGTEPFNLLNPGSIRHAYRDTGTFVIRLFVVNELGCVDSLSKEICVENRVRLFVPNAFTPNEDGVNDAFQIFGIGLADVNWKIYDRYGSLLFEGNGLEDAWDGTHRGRALKPDTFIVVVTYTDEITGRREVYSREFYLML